MLKFHVLAPSNSRGLRPCHCCYVKYYRGTKRLNPVPTLIIAAAATATVIATATVTATAASSFGLSMQIFALRQMLTSRGFEPQAQSLGQHAGKRMRFPHALDTENRFERGVQTRLT